MHATGHLARSCPSSNRFLTVCCVTVVPTAARMFAADAVQYVTAVCRIRRYSPSVETRGRPEPDLLEEVPSLDHCSQQTCTVDTCRSSLSAISRKENPLLVALLYDFVRTRGAVDNGFYVFSKAFLANKNSIYQISKINNAHKLYRTHLKQNSFAYCK